MVYAALRTDCVVLWAIYLRTPTVKVKFSISGFPYRTIMWLHFFYNVIILEFCNKSLGCLGGRISCTSHLVSCRDLDYVGHWQFYSLAKELTKIKADAGNVPCCYAHFPGISTKRLHSCTEFHFQKLLNLKLPSWSLEEGISEILEENASIDLIYFALIEYSMFHFSLEGSPVIMKVVLGLNIFLTTMITTTTTTTTTTTDSISSICCKLGKWYL